MNRGAYVPFHHQYLLAQTIKGVLVSGGNKDYQNSTEFNFSGLKGQTKISRKGLHFYSTRVTLVFSTSHPDFLEYFSRTLLSMKELSIGNLILAPEKVESEAPVVITDRVKYLCISPVVVVPSIFNDDSSKRFISPEGEEFSDLLYESTISRMEASGRFSSADLSSFYKFQIAPDRDYLQRIETNHKKFARIYPLYDSDIKYEVRGYTFPFTLFAAAPVQQFIFENGLGLFSHKGFGMLDVSTQNPINQNSEQELIYA